MAKKMTKRRHGDLQIQGTDLEEIPKGWELVPPTPRGVVLAEGEHTGHAHVVRNVALACLYRIASEEYALLHVKERINARDLPIELDHEEHHRQVYEPGIYRVGQKRQYTEDAAGWAVVED